MSEPNRDGHRIAVALRRDGMTCVDIVCPGDCHIWDDPATAEAIGEPCWLRYYVRESGSDFLEWIDGGPEYIPLDGHVLIEWWMDGDELWWRGIETNRVTLRIEDAEPTDKFPAGIDIRTEYVPPVAEDEPTKLCHAAAIIGLEAIKNAVLSHGGEKLAENTPNQDRITDDPAGP